MKRSCILVYNILIINDLWSDCDPKTGLKLNRLASTDIKSLSNQKQPSQELIMKNLFSKAFILAQKLFAITDVCHNEKITLQDKPARLKIPFEFRWQGPWLLWPDEMTYLQWKKTLKKVCWLLFSQKRRASLNNRGKRQAKEMLRALREAEKQKKTHKTTKRKSNALNRVPEGLMTAPKQNKLNAIAGNCDCNEGAAFSNSPITPAEIKKEQEEDVKIELVALLKKFLVRKHISEMIEKTIPEHRNPKEIRYSVSTIILAALSIFLLRMQSGNKYNDKTTDRDEKYAKKNISKFINAPEGHVPTIKTIADYLQKIDLEQINQLMVQFFQDLIKSKFFSEHPEIRVGNLFLIAVDCVHSHTYCKPHHLDHEGEPDCPYCLERIYNKGTPQVKVRWIHNTLVYTFVFLNHLKIPFYIYPIRAQQVKGLEGASDNVYKQECEIIALKKTLPNIRQFFPRMKICLLLDGLYANRPTIQLAKQYKCKYAIVRKEECLPSLRKDCNGLAQLSDHKKSCVKTTVEKSGKWEITRNYTWFNDMDLRVGKGESIITNVLRFSETRERINKITGKNESIHYKGEWLLSEKLSSRNCELSARKARLRWEEEDLFNTQKNREFNYKHDYSRNPCSFIIWQALSFFAFAIFELFRFSEPVMQRIFISISAKTTISRIALVEKLSAQLFERPTEEIFSTACMSKQIQFRYDFSPPKPPPKNKPTTMERKLA